MNKRIDNLEPEDYINSLLVIKGVRKAYLIQNFESTTTYIDRRIGMIQNIFPTLKIYKNKNNTHYFLAVDKLLLDLNDVVNIASVLRFSCDVGFNDLNRDKEMISYNINVFFNENNEEPLSIITYICQTKSTISDAIELVDDINGVLTNNIKLKKLNIIVSRVELQVNVIIPPLAFIHKLMDPKHVFTEPETDELNNIIYNTVISEDSSDIIINVIDYNNLIHRGVVLTYITEYIHNKLEPLIPIQTTEYYEGIKGIDLEKSSLMAEYLVDPKLMDHVNNNRIKQYMINIIMNDVNYKKIIGRIDENNLIHWGIILIHYD